MMNERSLKKNMEKQMGCMTGFLQIFDRHQILSAKRHYSAANRLPPLLAFDSASESEKSAPASPAMSSDFGKPSLTSPSPDFQMKEGTAAKCSWKFGKEAPRLSLDSRATTDAKGGLHPMEIRAGDGDESDETLHHRSPSVIARLMGLEPLLEPETTPELRRSASASRVSRDLFHSRFISERSDFSSDKVSETAADDDSLRFSDPINYLLKNAAKIDTPKGFNRGGGFQRKSFVDSGDFFPEPKQAVSIYGEAGNRLKLRGIEEPSKDLETLKQILEALQLKGLLHSRKHSEQHQIPQRTFVFDDSPIVVMKPSRSPNHNGSGGRKSYGLAAENPPSMSPRRDRNPPQTGRNPTTNRTEGIAFGRRSSSAPKPKPLSVETHNRRLSPVHSPKVNPRNGKSAAEINRKEKKAGGGGDESSSISGCSIVTTSSDTERCKSEEERSSSSLLERCDKLLHSIAEMNATEMQSSPVSVLDSSLYKDESSPSPIKARRSIDFKDECIELIEDWSSEIVSSQYDDFVYVSDIVRASHYLPQESDVFSLLEKQRRLKGKDTCRVSRLQRKLIFDTVHEILDRNRRLPPWKVASWGPHGPSLNKVWSELQRVRERDAAQDMVDTICGVLKKDLAGDGISGWEDRPLEMSEMILDIERLVFKDLIGEAIRDLAALESSNKAMLPPSLPKWRLIFSTPN
ncbi:protein LONGIFOLIA 1-like [Salvia divinorum]|uniref:Protein LONGIFOLIA 1-like n=1 Tax=Salvia divinorum TaxID=28513 RepID=A0ABD1GSS2_SALDI